MNALALNAKLERRKMRRYHGRKRTNAFFLVMSVLAAGFGLFWLGAILYSLCYHGFGGLKLTVFTEMTPAPTMEGGLLNAILGSIIISVMAVAVGTPIGILAGTYLAEYGRYSRLSFFVRFINDILLSAPSIVIGMFIWVILVENVVHGFSAIAGAVALAIIVIPVIVRTTENMLLLVPNGLREAAAALGAPRSFVIRAVTWRAARAGIVTGVLLAVARISGETAPLLFTAFNNQFWDDSKYALLRPMANLPVTIFNFAMSPYEDLQSLAWVGALLITVAVLTLSIIARILEKRS